VGNLDAGDFALATTNVTGASITGVSGSGTTYTVTVNTGTPINTGTHSIGLNLADDDSIIDRQRHCPWGTGTGNGNFTGQVYTINSAPVAQNGTLTTNEDTAATGTLVATDADGNTLTYSLVDTNERSRHRQHHQYSTGAYSYSPAADYFGSASFTFKGQRRVRGQQHGHRVHHR